MKRDPRLYIYLAVLAALAVSLAWAIAASGC